MERLFTWFVVLFELACVLLWLPPVAAKLGEVWTFGIPLQILLAPVAVFLLAVLLNQEATAPLVDKRTLGFALGLCGSFLAFTLYDATGLQLAFADPDAMKGLPTELLFQGMFTVFMPAMMGVFLCGSALGWTKWFRRRGNAISRELGLWLVPALGLAIGGLFAWGLHAEAPLSFITRLVDRGEATLGATGAAILPVLLSVAGIWVGGNFQS